MVIFYYQISYQYLTFESLGKQSRNTRDEGVTAVDCVVQRCPQALLVLFDIACLLVVLSNISNTSCCNLV